MRANFILAGIIAFILSSGSWAAGTAAPQTPIESYQVRASNLIGKQVRNAKDEKLGEIDDLVIQQGGHLYAVISVGGFLGLGERYVAVPYNQLRPAVEGDYLIYPTTKEELKATQQFEYKREGEWGVGR
jgi:sporulation protein YlmC with PRC-barrel domain